MPTFVIEDHMSDWQICQICYPHEIKLLLLILHRLWLPQMSQVMLLFVLRKLSLQTRMRSRPVGLDVWSLVGHFVYFYTMCANSVGSGESARMHRFAWDFAGRLCDKYHNLMSWPKCCPSGVFTHSVEKVTYCLNHAASADKKVPYKMLPTTCNKYFRGFDSVHTYGYWACPVRVK